MVLSPVSILGGDSVYCINEAQMEHAKKLAEEDPNSSIKIKSIIVMLNSQLLQISDIHQELTLLEKLKKIWICLVSL